MVVPLYESSYLRNTFSHKPQLTASRQLEEFTPLHEADFRGLSSQTQGKNPEKMPFVRPFTNNPVDAKNGFFQFSSKYLFQRIPETT